MIIAIDGPAGSGKGTIAKKLSEKLNLVYIDTGAIYRCLTLKVIQNNCTDDKDKIIELSSNIDVKFDLGGNVFLDGIDVTKEIRNKEVTNIVSPISSIVEVRKNLVDYIRKMANNNDIVMEGRDTTTVIFPNADYKFYLDASLEERIKRRMLQNKEKNINMSYEEVKENIMSRDYNDSNKKVGSLMKTDEQIYIDSTSLTIDEVVDIILKEVKHES